MGLFKDEAIRTGSPFRPAALKGPFRRRSSDLRLSRLVQHVPAALDPRQHPANRVRGQLLRSRNRPVSRRSRQQRSGLKPGTVQSYGRRASAAAWLGPFERTVDRFWPRRSNKINAASASAVLETSTQDPATPRFGMFQ